MIPMPMTPTCIGAVTHEVDPMFHFDFNQLDEKMCLLVTFCSTCGLLVQESAPQLFPGYNRSFVSNYFLDYF